MLQDFNKEQVIEYMKISERKEKNREEFEEVAGDVFYLETKLKRLNETKQQALVVRKNSSIFSKIANMFRRGKYYEAMQQMSETDDEIAKTQEELERTQKRKNDLIVERDNIETYLMENKKLGIFRNDDGRLVVTDEDLFDRGDSNDIEYRNRENIDSSKRVLVHCTNFFPRDNRILSNYDGGKILIGPRKYHGVNKEIRSLDHRHEVHFTINNRVESTGAGEGNWDRVSYIIVDRYDVHQNQMEVNDASDAWTNGTSIDLSEDAVIMINLQDKDKISLTEEEMKKYNIVYFDGDPTKCLRNFIRANDYEVFETDKNAGSHALSIRMKQEKAANGREQAIRFMTESQTGFNDRTSFHSKDIARIIDIAEPRPGQCLGFITQAIEKIIEERDIPENQREAYKTLIDRMIFYGVQKEQNGSYRFKSDEEIFNIFQELKNISIEYVKGQVNIDDFIIARRENDNEKLEQLRQQQQNNVMNYKERVQQYIDFDAVNEIFNEQQKLLEERLEEQNSPIADSTLSMPLEQLYQFKNQIECEKVQRMLPEGTTLFYSKDGVEINKHDEYGTTVLQMIITPQTTVSEMLERCNELTNKNEQINERDEAVPDKDYNEDGR